MAHKNSKRFTLNFTPSAWWHQCKVCKVCIQDETKFLIHKRTKHPNTYESPVIDISSSDDEENIPKSDNDDKSTRRNHLSGVSSNDTETTHSLIMTPPPSHEDGNNSTTTTISTGENEEPSDAMSLSNELNLAVNNENKRPNNSGQNTNSDIDVPNEPSTSNGNNLSPQPKRKRHWKIRPSNEIIEEDETDADDNVENPRRRPQRMDPLSPEMGRGGRDFDPLPNLLDQDSNPFSSASSEGTSCDMPSSPVTQTPQEEPQDDDDDDVATSTTIREGLGEMHVCYTCNKGFQYKASFNCHLSVAHLAKPNPDGPGKLYKCGIGDCPKIFGKTRELAKHAWSHTGESRYRCPNCREGFKKKSHFKGHYSLCKN